MAWFFVLRREEPDDLMVGDFARKGFFGPYAVVESIDGDHATIMWAKDRREICPLAILRRAPQRGSIYDSRRHGR